MNYTIYAHVLRDNPELARYVGYTSQPVNERWQNGRGYKGQYFYEAIQKYGWDNFEHLILEIGDAAPEYAGAREQYWCEEYQAYTIYSGGYTKVAGHIPYRRQMLIYNPLTINNSSTLTNLCIQLSELDWQTAFKDLSPNSFGIYLMLSQNANGFRYDWSPRAIEKRGLMSHTSAIRARQELEQKGYIVDGVFYVRPPKRQEQFDMLKATPPNVDEL